MLGAGLSAKLIAVARLGRNFAEDIYGLVHVAMVNGAKVIDGSAIKLTLRLFEAFQSA